MEELRKVITDIQQSLKQNRYSNEDAVKQGIVLPILDNLGWEIFDTAAVHPGFSVGAQKVSYALCDDITGEPKVFIEAKSPGKIEGGLNQLMGYIYRTHGSVIPVLTDGREWQFFYPMGAGAPEDRMVYELKLLEREPSEVARALSRYLGRKFVQTGVALADIQKDYQDKTQRDNAERSLPRAWKALVEEKDSLLVDLVEEKVAALTGHKLESDRVLKFLSNLRQPQTVTPENTVKRGVVAERREFYPAAEKQMGYDYFGKFYPARKVKQVLIEVIEKLCKRDGFAEAFATFPLRTRRYLARTPRELYISSPHIANQRGTAELLSNGYYLMVHVGKISVYTAVKHACSVAGIEYGKDIVVHL